MSDLDVDIWSDVMCPWCAVGYAQFARAVEQVKGDVDVTVRWMPFELNPDMPPAGKDQAQHLAEVYGRTPDEVEAMRAQMAERAAAAGFPMDYTGDGAAPPAMMWNTFGAHKLLRWALASSGPEAQTALKLALFRAHFNHRRNVADHDVLLDVVDGVEGLDRAAAAGALDDPALAEAVRYEEQRGRQSGITAVPTFVIAGKYMLQGAQEPEQFAKALLQIASMEAAA